MSENIEKSYPFEPGPVVGQLLEESKETWEAAVAHRFVTELFEGRLDHQVLRTYLIQDYQFFDAFLSMLGACVAYADTLESKLRFSKQLGFLSADEDGYFIKAFEILEVAERDYLFPRLHPVTRAFQDLMYAAVESKDYAHLLVMLVIAEGLYLDWGSKPLSLPEAYVYREWIDLHRGAFFTDWVQFLVDELNRIGHTRPDLDDLRQRWKQAVALEHAFFDLGYETGDSFSEEDL